MKKKHFILIAMVLAVSLLLVPQVSIAAVDQNTEDIDLAQQVAQARVDKISGLTHPQWEGAKAVDPEPYCDLKGRVICYMFAIEKDSKALGHVIVGSKLYNNSFFQASEVLPPTIPSQTEIQSIIQASAKVVASGDAAELLFLFYSGGFQDFFGIYDVGGKKIAINLFTKTVYLFDALSFKLLAPDKYQAVKAALKGTKSAGYKALPVYLYDSYSDCTSPSTGCGPASGAMIASYYESWYGNFPEWADYPNDGELDDCYEYLYDYMDTGWAGTSPTDFGPGFVDYAEDECGYYGFDDTFFYTRSIDDYWDIVDYIDDNTPMGGLVLSVSEQHWYAVRGYDYDTDSGDYDMICNSPSPNNGNGSVSWIGFWEKSWNNMVAIED